MKLRCCCLIISTILLGLQAGPVRATDPAQQAGPQYLVVSPDIELEFDRLYQQIQEAKRTDTEISEETYARFFELEGILNPDAQRRNSGSLDQGYDVCPGLPIVATDPMNWVDYGQTYNYQNNCTRPNCRDGKDIMFQMTVEVEDSFVISTCGSMFDTWLCLYSGSCCTGAPLLQNDDNPAICGPRTVRAAIGACLDAGTYYIVLDGFSRASYGHYQLSIVSGAGGCTPIIIPECPPSNTIHTERFENEAACEAGDTITCPARICGEINSIGDIDAFTFELFECTIVTISAFADDSPGSYAFGEDLNPYLQLFTTVCEAPIYFNDNFNNSDAANEIYGNDSRIITACLRPARYWVELGGIGSGTGSTGPWEFWLDCTPCGNPNPIIPSQDYDFDQGIVYLDWPDAPPGTTFYVWKRVCNGCGELQIPLPEECWELIATTQTSQFSEPINEEYEVLYVVFDNPCGVPNLECGQSPGVRTGSGQQR